MKSPVLAVVLAFAGIIVILAVAAGVQLSLAYGMSHWQGVAERLPVPARYAVYVGGLAVAVLVGFAAPPVGRLGRAFERKFVRWLVSFVAGMAGMAVVLGAGLFACWCVPWGHGFGAVLSLGLYVVVFAAILWGGWGTIKAIRG